MDDIAKLNKTQNYPVENIFLQRLGNVNFRVGIASMQGFREKMEDTHVAVLQLPNHADTGLFGVFDGHAGTKASEWCAEHIPTEIDNLTSFTEEVIKKKMIEIDQRYLELTGDLINGATAVFCTLQKTNEKPDQPYKATVVNLGDSRCFVARPRTQEYTCLTRDHKPGNQEEVVRIQAAGGYVARGRVDSLLAVSRSFGDHRYKDRKDLPPDKQKVIPVPDVFYAYLGQDDFLLVCCDGLIPHSNSDAGIFQFLFRKFRKTTDSAKILSHLLRHVLKSGSTDNMTALLVECKNGGDYSGEEFLAGKFYEGGNATYLAAYQNDCDRNGKKVAEVQELWKIREEGSKRKKREGGRQGEGSDSEDSDV